MVNDASAEKNELQSCHFKGLDGAVAPPHTSLCTDQLIILIARLSFTLFHRASVFVLLLTFNFHVFLIHNFF